MKKREEAVKMLEDLKVRIGKIEELMEKDTSYIPEFVFTSFDFERELYAKVIFSSEIHASCSVGAILMSMTDEGVDTTLATAREMLNERRVKRRLNQ